MLKRLFTIVLLLGVGAGIAVLYVSPWEDNQGCLLYTSDAADE